MSIITRIQELEDSFRLPETFDESCTLYKEEIIDNNIVTTTDLSDFSDELLVYCSSFNQDNKDMLLSVVVDEDNGRCMYIISEGESTIDKLLKKGFLEL